LRLAGRIETFMLPLVNYRPVNIMRRLLFGCVIFNFLQLFPAIDALYGVQNSLIATQSLNGFTLTTLVNLLSVDALKSYYMLFFMVQLCFAFMGMLGFWPRVSSFVVFFTTINLQNRIYPTLTGGDVLLCLMLFYTGFISEGKKLQNEHFNQVQNAFNRIFTWLCKIQLVIVYAISAIYKLQSPQWLDGSAVQQLLLINEYSFPALQRAVCAAPFLFKLLTWLVLLYQLAFPLLVFVKRVKKYLLFSGVVFHFFIAFAMGLFNFSLVMICCYAVFYDFEEKTALNNEAFS
jgi:hypothetical protein